MFSQKLSRLPMTFAILAIVAGAPVIGCAQQPAGVQADATTPPDVDLSPKTPQPPEVDLSPQPREVAADDASPSLNAADTTPALTSAAPPAELGDLEGPGDAAPPPVPPIAATERVAQPAAPAVPEASDELATDVPGVDPDAFAQQPDERTVEQRLDLMEQRLEYHKQAIQEINAAPSVDERLEKMENELADLRKSFNNVAKLITEDQRPSIQPENSKERISEKRTSEQLGLLVIENQTGLAYPMTVNGYRFQIIPGRHQFKVPVGEVVTELNGFEDAKRWRAGDWRDVNGQQQLAIQIQ